MMYNTAMKILLLTLIILFTACGGSNDIPDGAIKTSVKTSQTTPKGVNVYSEKGLSQEQLNLIDAGIQSAFTDAIASGYSVGLDSRAYIVRIPVLPCVLSPQQGVPSFRLRADSYDGTDFDFYNPEGAGVKDGIGVILASEQVTGLNGDMIVCPEVSHLKEAVRNGAEHCIISQNDYDYFNLTWFHGDGFYHPLLPKRTQLKTPVSKPYNGSTIIIPVK